MLKQAGVDSSGGPERGVVVSRLALIQRNYEELKEKEGHLEIHKRG